MDKGLVQPTADDAHQTNQTNLTCDLDDIFPLGGTNYQHKWKRPCMALVCVPRPIPNPLTAALMQSSADLLLWVGPSPVAHGGIF